MHREIVRQRHVPLFHLRGDVLRVGLGAIPLGKVQMVAAAIHIVLNKPGYRCDLGIPGPHGLIAMAVKAGAAEQCPCVG